MRFIYDVRTSVKIAFIETEFIIELSFNDLSLVNFRLN